MVQKKQKRFVVPHIPDSYRNEGAAGPILFGRKGDGALPACSSTEQPPPVNPGQEQHFDENQNMEKCPNCNQAPCVVEGSFRCFGSRGQDIRNHSQRHKDYKKYWKSLKDLGFWENPDYLRHKTAAGISEDELREVMPVCILKDVRKRYPNPDGIPYMGHKRF